MNDDMPQDLRGSQSHQVGPLFYKITTQRWESELLASIKPIVSTIELTKIEYTQKLESLKIPESALPEGQETSYWFGADLMDYYYAMDALGIAAILVVSERVKSLRNLMIESKHAPGDRFYKAGVKIGDAYWVEILEAASNYVRHREEWQSDLNKRSQELFGESLHKQPNDWVVLLDSLKGDSSKRQKQNILTLLNLSLDYQDFLMPGSKKAFRFAELLGLDSVDTVLKNFSCWKTSVDAAKAF